MIMVTDAWLAQMEESTDYVETVIITLADNTQITLGRDDLRFGDNISSGSESNSVPLGEAICKTCTIHIDNSDGTYDNTNFLGATIVIKASMYLTEMEWTEEIVLGTFYVSEPQETGSVIEVTGVDAMHKADKPFTVPQALPMTAANVFANACQQSGLQYASLTFYNYDFQISTIPTGLTCRQVIGYIALIACGNAVIDANNCVDILTYYFQPVEDYPDDWVYPVFKDWVSPPNLYANDITITGIKATVTNPTGEETTYTAGTDDYVVSFGNPLIAGHEQDIVNDIYSTIAGISFFPFSGSHTGYPMVEFMDSCIVIDIKGGIHYSFVTQFEFTFLGTTKISNTLPPPIVKQSVIPSEAAQVEQRTHEAIKTETTRIDTAIANITTRISGMSGMYITKVEQQGGGVVIYQHDKPTLAESQKIWMETAETRAVSMDGGQTWVAGVTADGQAIVRHLAAEGVSASWIDTGTLQISNGSGGVLFLASIDTGTVNIAGWTIDGTRIYKDVSAETSADGKHFYIGLRSYPYTASQSNPYNLVFWVQYDDLFRFYVRSNGFLFASDAEISGKITATSGSIAGWTIDGSRIYKDIPAASAADGKHYYIGLRSNPYDSSQTNPYNLAFWVQYDDLFRFFVRSNGYLFASDADIKGKITATSGQIAGWSITQYSLKATSNGLTTGLQVPSHGVYAIAVGSTSESSWSSAPFRVTHDGAMTSSAGNIAGWDIGTTSLSNGTYGTNASLFMSVADLGTLTIAAQSVSGLRFVIGTKFGVTKNGNLYASDVNLSGTIRTVSNTRYTQVKAGAVQFGKVGTDSDTGTGVIAPIAWGNDYQNKEGVMFGITRDAKYLALAYDTSTSGSSSYQAALIINNGLNPSSITQEVIVNKTTYFKNDATFNGNILGTNGGLSLSYINGGVRYPGIFLNSGANYGGYTQRVLLLGSVYIQSAVYVDDSISCTVCTQRSDENFKDITEYDRRYSDVLDELIPITFTWKDSDDSAQHVGLGARHTREILDNHGLTDSGFSHETKDGEYGINYSELTVMLLAKVQQQQKTIDALESRIKRLETLVEGLL